VWMRTAGLTNFRKLWGRIRQDIVPGLYTIEVVNNYNATQYHAHKSLILTTTNWIGGRNSLLPITFLVLCLACLFIGLFFLLKERKIKAENRDRID
jgi:hypothetical protein